MSRQAATKDRAGAAQVLGKSEIFVSIMQNRTPGGVGWGQMKLGVELPSVCVHMKEVMCVSRPGICSHKRSAEAFFLPFLFTRTGVAASYISTSRSSEECPSLPVTLAFCH